MRSSRRLGRAQYFKQRGTDPAGADRAAGVQGRRVAPLAGIGSGGHGRCWYCSGAPVITAAWPVQDRARSGWQGTAFGPMADVVRLSTQHMTDADLQAVATYLQSLPPRAPTAAAPFRQAASHEQGGKLYAQRCADCHGDHGQGVAGVYPPLDGNTSVTGPTSVNAVRSVLLGGFAPATAANPRPYSMPPFAQQLDDAEVAAVVGYIRQSWSNKAGAVTPGEVGRYRHTPVD
ncbi:c-type cytochrome [Rhodanobacter lindaniclasticus]